MARKPPSRMDVVSYAVPRPAPIKVRDSGTLRDTAGRFELTTLNLLDKSCGTNCGTGAGQRDKNPICGTPLNSYERDEIRPFRHVSEALEAVLARLSSRLGAAE